MSDNIDENILQQLTEISNWLKLAHGEAIRQRLEKILDTEIKKRAYEATDGSASTRDIAKLVGVDQKTISRWWSDWSKAGLVEPSIDRQDRPRKLIPLTYFKLL